MASAGAALLAKKRGERWHLAYGPDIAKPRPPIPYVCKDLAMSPGASIWGGSGFSGKTTTLQALMLAIVSGMPAWGQFPVERGDIMHTDFEQGPDLTFLKYQRMARNMKVDVEGLGDRLACSSLPTDRLDHSQASRDELRWLFEGRKAGILDAFKGAFPDAQENDSGARKYLDMVHEVGLEQGCAIIVVAHSRKMIDGIAGDARSSLRGSSALFDAPQTVWVLTSERHKPTRCENVKERLRGKLRETFGLTIEDVPGLGAESGEIDDEWGLDVRYLAPSELQAAYAVDNERDDNSLAINADRIHTLGLRIGTSLACAPDGLTMAIIKSLQHGTPATFINAAVDMLIQSGAVRADGKGSSAVYYADERQPGED